jgi:hypothetical protein
MSITRRSLASLIAVAACLPFAAAAQEWPAKPIRIVVPFAAGGTSDILARALGERLQAALKQTVIIDNKAGAGGVIGADSVAKSAPDGTTFLLGTIASHAINPVLNPKMPYDAAKDFAPVILLGSISNVLLVGADQPYRNVKELIAASSACTTTARQTTSPSSSGNDGGLPAGSPVRLPGGPGGHAALTKVPQAHKVALVDLKAGDAVRRYGVTIGRARATSPPAAGCTKGCSRCPRRAQLDGPADGHRQGAGAAAAGRPQLPGLPQRRRLGGHAQPAGHHHHGAVRGRRAGPCVRAHPPRAAAAVPERGRRGRPGARLRLRRGHRRARCGDPHPHAAPHQPQPELRRRGDGGQPGLREAAARAAAAAGKQHRPPAPPPPHPSVDVRLQDERTWASSR